MIVLPLLLAASILAQPPAAGEIPARPEQIRMEPLKVSIPDPGPLRHRIAGGVPVFVVEDHALPLAHVTVLLRAGAFLDPPGKDGLAAMTATLVRRGGTVRHPFAELEEVLETLATRVDSSADDAYATVSLECLSSRLGESLDLLFAMLAQPSFGQEAIEAEKRRMVNVMTGRNDDPGRILDREWRWLLYGHDHVVGRYSTAPGISPVTRADLAAFHARYWTPANMVLAVSGDVDTRAVLARLEAGFASWKEKERPAPWPPEPPRHRPVPGLYYVDVEARQSQVAIGHLAPAREGRWDDRGLQALAVAQQVLGGGGFTSRLMRRLRTDKGLVYGVSSALEIGPLWPEPFEIRFAADPANAAQTKRIALEEVTRLRAEKISDSELEAAKNGLLAGLAEKFSSARETARTFALDQTLGRPHAYWRDYPVRLQAVTAEAVQAAAREYLHPDQAIVLVVGRWDASQTGWSPLSPQRLPLRDPLTLEPAK